jgi:hypothetical protein
MASSHLRALEIPTVHLSPKIPDLLLDGIIHGLPDEAMSSAELFSPGAGHKCVYLTISVDLTHNNHPRFFVNSSGSGKTSLSAKGLLEHWGFYFSCEVSGFVNPIGSVDLSRTIDHVLSNIPETPADPDTMGRFLSKNVRDVDRAFLALLYSRALVMERFRSLTPTLSEIERRELWTILQLRPTLGSSKSSDMFSELELPMDHSTLVGLVPPLLTKISNTLGLVAPEKLWIVLDEAQSVTQGQTHFVNQKNLLWPVLHPIVACWTHHFDTGVTLIISGTGTSMANVDQILSSSSFKPSLFNQYTKTGVFKTESQIVQYLS